MPNIKKIIEFTGHDSSIYALEKAGDYSFYSASADKMVARWNLQTMEADKFSIRLDSVPYALHYSANFLLVGQGQGGLHLFDLEAKRELKHLILHKKAIFHILEIPEGFVLSSADGSFTVLNSDYSIRFYKKLSDQKIRKACYNEQLKIIYLFAGDGHIHIYSIEKNALEGFFLAHETSSNIGFVYKEGNVLITGGRDAKLNLWDIAENYHLKLSIPAHNFAIYDIKRSPCNRFLATASRDKTIKIWDIKTMEVLARIDRKNYLAHTHSVNTLLWMGKYLVSAGDDRKIMVWEIE